MLKAYPTFVVARIITCLLPVIMIATSARCSDTLGGVVSANMVFVEGGTFEMGDVSGEGNDNETPVHRVTLSDFQIAKFEVTVGDFRQFTLETGYQTSAEGPEDSLARLSIMKKFAADDHNESDRRELHAQFLQLPGSGYWDAEKRQWTGYNPQTNWRNPGIEQTDNDPVLAVSVDDAMHFCNWLSNKAGLPVAYDLASGAILDENGRPTQGITKVKGYRLPTEAEWEYAARERGRKVRFGNGKNIAKSSEINFRADDGEYEYLELGQYLKGTSPVGSYSPNSLGLYDMSGNAWEWAGDKFATYTAEAQINPCRTDARGHALRGGRWGGDASEARVFSRSSWVRNDRCNNSGFRVAKSR
jgi:formylglycine-generating enzyme required for sulfatase activity